MKDFKGTPGPWLWQDDGSGYSWLGPVGCSPLEAVHHDGSAWGEYSADIDVEGFDAKIIAAAPDLLSSLQELVNSLEITLRVGYERIIELGGECDRPEVMFKGHSEIARAKQAIAKALGESK